jgi:hypothetical protein
MKASALSAAVTAYVHRALPFIDTVVQNFCAASAGILWANIAVQRGWL